MGQESLQPDVQDDEEVATPHFLKVKGADLRIPHGTDDGHLPGLSVTDAASSGALDSCPVGDGCDRVGGFWGLSRCVRGATVRGSQLVSWQQETQSATNAGSCEPSGNYRAESAPERRSASWTSLR